MKISTKLGYSHLAMGLLPLIAFGIVFYYILIENTYIDLKDRNEIKKNQIKNYFDQKKNDLSNITDTAKVLENEALKK